jgi:hypothetical protein
MRTRDGADLGHPEVGVAVADYHRIAGDPRVNNRILVILPLVVSHEEHISISVIGRGGHFRGRAAQHAQLVGYLRVVKTIGVHVTQRVNTGR